MELHIQELVYGEKTKPEGEVADNKDKSREKAARARAEEQSEIPSWTDGIPLSPSWWAPVFITLLIVGLLWIVIFYFSSYQFPIPGIRNWNLLIGIGIMMVGFIMTLKWR